MHKTYFTFLFILMFWLLPIGQALAIEPDDTYIDELWYLEQIDAFSAWDQQTGSDAVVVAILDSGLDLDHPDLEGNLWVNEGEIADNGIDDDGNGYIDDIHGWDFVDFDSSPSPTVADDSLEDAVAHGSLVAGIVGAVGDNAEGIVGIAWDVQLMSVRMLDDVGSGTSFEAARALDYAVENGADIVNLSFAGEEQDPALRSAIRRAYKAGVTIVAALGNEAQDTDRDPVYPACFYTAEEDWVIGVVSSTEEDHRSSFSNYGNRCADISAPGEDIFGISYQDDDEGYDEYYVDGWSGTSMASPVVAGAAALLLSEYPSLTPDDIRTVLKLSVDPMDVADSMVGRVGAGRLNVARALEYAAAYADEDEGGEETVEAVEGDTIKAPSYDTVYYLSDSDERRAYINATAYFTYFDSFDVIVDVMDDDLSNYALSGLMLPKPGVVLVKIQSDSTVYYVEEGDDAYTPMLRAISSEDIAIEMFGENWADYVVDIESTFFSKYDVGDTLEEAMDVDTSIMKTREELAALAD